VLLSARDDTDFYGGAEAVIDKLKALAASPIGYAVIIRFAPGMCAGGYVVLLTA
jgi:hypothetical protein